MPFEPVVVFSTVGDIHEEGIAGMKRLIIFLTLLPGYVCSETIETWKCSPGSHYSASNVVLTAKVNVINDDNWILQPYIETDTPKKVKVGEINVAGTSHYGTDFVIEGFNKRWNFGLVDGGVYRYAFVIKPDGDGLYYDFGGKTEEVSPSQFFSCIQI